MSSLDMRSLSDILTEYCANNWYLFPVSPKTKRPSIKDNLNQASNDLAQLLTWAKQFPGCNWGVSLAKSKLVAVDVDEDEAKGGLDKWGAYIINNTEPDTLKAQSGSGRGLHYVFKDEPGIRYKGKITDGIDVKHNGYILVYPSIHPRTKGQYKWLNEKEPQPAPDWLRKLIEKQVEAKGKKSVSQTLSSGFYTKIIDQLKQKVFGYEEWLKLGMSLHAAFNGSEEGLDLYLDLTQGLNYKEGDLEAARSKWEGFKPDALGVQGGTFVYLARHLGCEIPNPDLESDKDLFRQAAEAEQAKEADDNPGWFVDDEGRHVTVHIEFLVEDINSMGWGFLSSAGFLVKVGEDENGLKQVRTFNKDRFQLSLAQYFYKFYVKDPSGKLKPKYIPAADAWLRHSKRKEYSDIVFRPNAPEGVVDLWSPIPCGRVKGDVSELLGFIEEVICAGNLLKADYLLKWVAHLVQKPQEKSAVVPVLIGTEGTGKGFFTNVLLRGILKNYYTLFYRPGSLVEKFNEDQSRKLLTVLDEALWGTKREFANVLKSVTGNNIITVEEKFGGKYSLENFSRYMLTANDEDCVRIDPGNRRYLVLTLSDSQIGNDKLFKRLHDGCLKGDLCERFYDYLMRIDLSQFTAFKFPKEIDDGGVGTKVESLGPVGGFWWDLLVESPKPIIETFSNCTKGYSRMNRSFVMGLYAEYVKNVHQRPSFSPRKFWAESRKIIPLLDKKEIWYRNDAGMQRGFDVTAHSLIESFCAQLRVSIPDAFDDLALTHVELPSESSVSKTGENFETF